MSDQTEDGKNPTKCSRTAEAFKFQSIWYGNKTFR